MGFGSIDLLSEGQVCFFSDASMMDFWEILSTGNNLFIIASRIDVCGEHIQITKGH